MSRRNTLARAFPVVAACALVLGACGEQIPGGMPAEAQHVDQGAQGQGDKGEQHTADQVVGEQPADAGAATGEPDAGSDADDPIVVKIGDEEFATNMAIYRKYDGAKGSPLALQVPAASAEELDGGKKQDYAAGSIYWSPESGAQIVRGQILATYLDNGGPSGRLGWPVGDETVEGESIFSDFQHGQIRLENQSIRVIEHAG